MNEEAPKPVPWSPHYPDHIISAGHDLLRKGYSLRTVERKLREMFPGESTPSHSTLRQYELRLVETLDAESESRESRIIAAADDLIARGLEQLEDEKPEKIIPNLAPLNAIAGTYRDKAHRRETRQAPQGPFIIFQGITIDHDLRAPPKAQPDPPPTPEPPTFEGEPPEPSTPRER
jgi:hypothetical protein